MLLIQGPDREDPMVRRQIDVLARANPNAIEALGFIAVLAMFVSENRSGYHTSLEVARRLASDSQRFRVTLLSPGGGVLKQSNEVWSMASIQAALTYARHEGSDF